ncbi:MAG: ankyrin repeat domain-containing protein [Bacteroidota bacterium]
MKKTILTVGMVCGMLLTGALVSASVTQPEVHRESSVVVAFEINAFCKAIIQGDIDTVKKMIADGQDVNKRSLGKTPAHYAARYNKPEILQVLIDNGANLRKRCAQGYTVKKYAELADAQEVINVINAAMKK